MAPVLDQPTPGSLQRLKHTDVDHRAQHLEALYRYEEAMRLARKSPNLDESSEAVERMIRDGNQANEGISRIHALAQKAKMQNTLLNIHKGIQEVVLLVHNEAARTGVTVSTGIDRWPPVGFRRPSLERGETTCSAGARSAILLLNRYKSNCPSPSCTSLAGNR
jgi:hypothetical protein